MNHQPIIGWILAYKNLNSLRKLPWAPNPLKWHHHKQKKDPEFTTDKPRLAFTTGSHAFGWCFFIVFLKYWLDNLIGKLLSGFQLGNHQVCFKYWLKYWKILKIWKVQSIEKQRLSTIPRMIFGSHYTLVNFGILGISKIPTKGRVNKEPKRFKHFPL